MRHLRLSAFAAMVLALVQAEAQTPTSVSEVIVAPFAVDSGDGDALRATANSCSEQLVAALSQKGVAVARDPQLSEKNLRSAAASWAVLGRLSRKEGQFQLELQLLDVKSGDEMRSYFNSDKDPRVACRAVGKVAERIAAFVKGQKGSQPNP